MKTVWGRSTVLATLALLAFGEGAQATILLTENFGSGGPFPGGWTQTITSPGTPAARS